MMFGWFKKKDKPLKEMSLKEVTAHLYDTFPSIRTQGDYEPPKFRCTRWILLCGPAYQDEGYVGSFILDSKMIYEKVKRIDENMSVSVEAEEQAKHHFPKWVQDADFQDSSVTLLDQHQHSHLKPWLADFIAIKACEIWCPSCKSFSRNMDKKDKAQKTEGTQSSWTEHWVCSSGHDLRHQDQTMRWII